MINSKFLKRLFIPSASTFVVHAKGKDSKEEKLPAECEKLIKALDLPLYKDKQPKSVEQKPTLGDDNVLIKTIRCMREELKVFSEQFSIVRQQVAEVFLVGKAHTNETIEYLREPENTYPRIGAITGGALTGYLFALRKGRFKKLVFLGAGAGVVSSVLYPDEAKEFGEEGLKHMKKYVIIAYHFLNGDGGVSHIDTVNENINANLEPETIKYSPIQQEYLDIQTRLAEAECQAIEPPPPPKCKPQKEHSPRKPKPPHSNQCKCSKDRPVKDTSTEDFLKGPCMTRTFNP